MPVAKSFANLPVVGEPFKENGKMYIMVKGPKGEKKVRWYNDVEYARMYNEAPATNSFNARHAFGFRKEGFITIFKGDEDKVRDWAQAQWPPRAWYNTIFHFYTPGFMPVENLPEGITPIKLTWDEVKKNDTEIKPYEEVEKYVMACTIDLANSTSQFQGEPDEWIERELIVKENATREDHYGEKHTHTMVDAQNNIYIWETGTKNFEVDSSIKLKMKVKAHKEINGVKTTIVWYCKVV